MSNRTQLTGDLPHNSGYAITVPDAWNGVLINDLDYAGEASGGAPSREVLLDRGYALSGTTRVRFPRYELRHDTDNQVAVLDIVRDKVGAPAHTIQLGCSRGGMIALAMGELHPE